MTRHIVIPDTQVKPGVDTRHMKWIGEYIADKQPDVVVHLGDHWDMPSLSVYDKPGSKAFEGRRFVADVEAGNKAFAELNAPIQAEIRRQKKNRRKNVWNPRLVLLRGNHEERILRAVNSDPAKLEGIMGYEQLESPGWETHEFLEPVWIDGVCYSHYLASPMTGKPYGGQSIDTRLKTVGHSFTMGHQQTLMFGRRPTLAGTACGLVAGSCYLHTEDYRGPQGNAMDWHGIVVKNEVADGTYDPAFVSLNYLSKKYTGKPLTGQN